MDGNFNTSKIMRALKSKKTVTAICAVLIVIVLVVAYNIRVNKATSPVSIPIAKETIQPKTLITDAQITTVRVPKDSLAGRYYTNRQEIIGKYSNVNTLIPEGSLFYKDAIVSKEELPDAALYDLKDGEVLYYMTVNMLTTYSNSVLPGNYIDIYVSTKIDGKAAVGKLLSNVKILAVKTSDGLNVFENAEESRTPYLLIFGLEKDNFLLMKKITAINNYSVFTEAGGSKIDLSIVPTTVGQGEDEGEIKTNVTSQYLKDYILNMSEDIPEEETQDISNLEEE